LTDESLIREVDEEVRLEQYKQLWRRYGNLIVAVGVIVVAVVAGYKGWQYYDLKRSEAAARDYFAAVDLAAAEGKSEEAAKRLQSLGGGSHLGYAMLASLQHAADLAKTGKTEEAVRAYDAIAGATGNVPAMRDLARIRAGYLLADTATPSELGKRVATLNVDGNPWRNHAREITALASYRARDYIAADRLANEILVDPQATESQRRRAQLLVSLLAPRLDKPIASAK
jgi:hypothetical protein